MTNIDHNYYYELFQKSTSLDQLHQNKLINWKEHLFCKTGVPTTVTQVTFPYRGKSYVAPPRRRCFGAVPSGPPPNENYLQVSNFERLAKVLKHIVSYRTEGK